MEFYAIYETQDACLVDNTLQLKSYLHSSRPRWLLPSLTLQDDPDTKKTERISRISGNV